MGLISDWIDLDKVIMNWYTETSFEIMYTFTMLMPVVLIFLVAIAVIVGSGLLCYRLFGSPGSRQSATTPEQTKPVHSDCPTCTCKKHV